MAQVVFMEKPGCVTNARQRRRLEDAGHTVHVRSLLTATFTRDDLLAHFDGLAVAEWFNPASPRVTSGAINPACINPETALSLMLDDPLLIRRPLIEAEGQRVCGFDNPLVHRLLGETTAASASACSRPDGPPCPSSGAQRSGRLP